jgi:hypothetical protein
MEYKSIDRTDFFNKDDLGCCIETGACRPENLSEKLVHQSIGKTFSDCEDIIAKVYLKEQEKWAIKWRRKIGLKIPDRRKIN